MAASNMMMYQLHSGLMGYQGVGTLRCVPLPSLAPRVMFMAERMLDRENRKLAPLGWKQGSVVWRKRSSIYASWVLLMDWFDWTTRQGSLHLLVPKAEQNSAGQSL
ncbi:hepatocyte growth factor [Sarotherodon galilaeus]